MKKKIKLDYAQLTLLQEFVDVTVNGLLEKRRLQRELILKGVPTVTFLINKNGKIKETYYNNLLTEEEQKIMQFDMDEKVNLMEIEKIKE